MLARLEKLISELDGLVDDIEERDSELGLLASEVWEALRDIASRLRHKDKCPCRTTGSGCDGKGIMSTKIYVGNALEVLPKLEVNSVHCSVSSPPYYGLRKYQGSQQCEWPEIEYSPMLGLPPIRLPGCDSDCEHEWVETVPFQARKASETKSLKQLSNRGAAMPDDSDVSRAWCQKCGGWRGALGNEPTLEMYIGHLVAIYREVYRVLREDGVAWVVMGDSYAGSWGNYAPGGIRGKQRPQTEKGKRWNRKAYGDTTWRPPTSYYPQGNLMMVPHRLALALQADSWIVRNDLVWHKKAPMPESVAGHRWERHRIKVKKSDRATSPYHEAYGEHPQGAGAPQWVDCPGCPKCEGNDGYVLKRGSWRHTRSHEFVLMLVKKMQYWSDQEEVREVAICAGDDRKARARKGHKSMPMGKRGGIRPGETKYDLSVRNPRSVLTPKPENFPGPHFAVFSTNLIEPLIKATCPDKCCPRCGQGWSPVVERSFKPQPDVSEEKGRRGILNQKPMDESNTWQGFPRGTTESNILGYRPSCDCGHDDHIPGTILDPFLGSGTTALVTERLGLHCIGIELSETYAQMAHDRIVGDAPLLTNVEISNGAGPTRGQK